MKDVTRVYVKSMWIKDRERWSDIQGSPIVITTRVSGDTPVV